MGGKEGVTKDRSTSCHGGTMLLTVGGDGEFDQIGAARGQCAGPQHQGRTVHLRHEAGGRQLHGQALLGDDVRRGRGRPHRVHLHAVHRRAWQWGRQLLHPWNCNRSTIHQQGTLATYLLDNQTFSARREIIQHQLISDYGLLGTTLINARENNFA